jgi:hypothetical protein
MSGSRATADNFEDMFSNMPGMEDDNETEDTSSTETQGTEQSEGAEQQGSLFDRSTGDGGREDTHRQTTEDPNRIVKRQDGLVERQSATDPRRRDLVDPVTGQIVAQGGIERRVYEQAKRNEREANALRAEVQQLRAHTQGMQQANTVATQLGLQPDVQITAMRVMADFMKDPVRTIEYLIAEVKGKGYNIPSLQGAGQGTDMEALAKLIDQRLQPITSRYQQEQQLSANHQRAQRDLDNFLTDVPDARANLDIIAEMITGDNTLSLDRAYTRFVQWCSANQLDPTQHVGPQLQYRQQQQQVAQPGAQPRQATRPLPGNRQLNGSSIPLNSRVAHDADADWSAIIAESMSDAGMR